MWDVKRIVLVGVILQGGCKTVNDEKSILRNTESANKAPISNESRDTSQGFNDLPNDVVKNIVSHEPLEVVSLSAIKIKEQKVDQEDPSSSYVIVEVKGLYESHRIGVENLGLEFIPNIDAMSLQSQSFDIKLLEIRSHYPQIAIPSSVVSTVSSPKPFAFEFKIQPMGLPFGWRALTWQFAMEFQNTRVNKKALFEAKLENTDEGPKWVLNHENFNLNQ